MKIIKLAQNHCTRIAVERLFLTLKGKGIGTRVKRATLPPLAILLAVWAAPLLPVFDSDDVIVRYARAPRLTFARPVGSGSDDEDDDEDGTEPTTEPRIYSSSLADGTYEVTIDDEGNTIVTRTEPIIEPTTQPTPTPSPQPTTATTTATTQPTAAPTPTPSDAPTPTPSPEPTTATATTQPTTATATTQPTAAPTPTPSDAPTPTPSTESTTQPTTPSSGPPESPITTQEGEDGFREGSGDTVVTTLSTDPYGRKHTLPIVAYDEEGRGYIRDPDGNLQLVTVVYATRSSWSGSERRASESNAEYQSRRYRSAEVFGWNAEGQPVVERDGYAQVPVGGTGSGDTKRTQWQSSEVAYYTDGGRAAAGPPANLQYETSAGGETVTETIDVRGGDVQVSRLADDSGVTVWVSKGSRGEQTIEVPVVGFDAEGHAYVHNPDPGPGRPAYMIVYEMRPDGDHGALPQNIAGWSDDGKVIFGARHHIASSGQGDYSAVAFHGPTGSAADHPSRTDPNHPNYERVQPTALTPETTPAQPVVNETDPAGVLVPEETETALSGDSEGGAPPGSGFSGFLEQPDEDEEQTAEPPLTYETPEGPGEGYTPRLAVGAEVPEAPAPQPVPTTETTPYSGSEDFDLGGGFDPDAPEVEVDVNYFNDQQDLNQQLEDDPTAGQSAVDQDAPDVEIDVDYSDDRADDLALQVEDDPSAGQSPVSSDAPDLDVDLDYSDDRADDLALQAVDDPSAGQSPVDADAPQIEVDVDYFDDRADDLALQVEDDPSAGQSPVSSDAPDVTIDVDYSDDQDVIPLDGFPSQGVKAPGRLSSCQEE